jgi:hypothetical protein
MSARDGARLACRVVCCRVVCCRAVCCLVVLGLAVPAHAGLDLRLKAFTSQINVPRDDVRGSIADDPLQSNALDVRTLFSAGNQGWQFSFDHTALLLSGDTVALGGNRALDPAPVDDDARRFDLTWTVDTGSEHQILHRLDRLVLDYRGADWGVAVGRQAVSWGSGIVFQPLDLFAPFAPTTVDRDYKPGEDVLVVDRLFADGSDLQVLSVFRRDEAGRADADAGSLGARWHRAFGAGEIEWLGGRHVGDTVLGVSIRHPAGGAMVRAEALATETESGERYISALLNMDYSLAFRGRNVYVFGELYRNGFGVASDRVDLARLPARLQVRLRRGEVFNLQRHYAALGGTVEWHPLVTQSLTLISSLDDGSVLAQGELRWSASDALRVDVGALVSMGNRGDEFGALPVPGPDVTAAQSNAGSAPTLGGGRSLYLRLVWFGRVL